MATFSKTRIYYYDNAANDLAIGNTASLEISSLFPVQGNPYLSVEIPGTVHNWSTIPYNTYGLYCTFAEIQSLVENSDSFCPVKSEITVGHTIPLATYPSTANSTQLSFNNTIFSFIAENDDGYIGCNKGIQANEINNLCRTFDGSIAGTSTTRNNLPKRNMYFRIPYHTLPTSLTTTAPVNETSNVPVGTTGTSAIPSVTTRNEIDQNIQQLIDSYIPELLQNNDKVFTLYPGENQYQKDISEFDKDFATIDTSGPAFNETLWQLDQRLQSVINRDTHGLTQQEILALPLLHQIKGNFQDFTPRNMPLGAAGSQANNTSAVNRFHDIMCNRRDSDDFTFTLPILFIKGVPILDSNNSLVPHTFMCTITHTLTLDTTPRSHMNSNRLQWAMTYPIIRNTYTADGDLDKTTSHYAFQANFAKKPFNHKIFKRDRKRIFNNLTQIQWSNNTSAGRPALKNIYKNAPAPVVPVDDAFDDETDNVKFGFTMPFSTLYTGHPVNTLVAIPTNTANIPSTSGNTTSFVTTEHPHRHNK